MDDRMQALAAGEARQLLQRFRESYPQWAGDRTPLDELTTWLGLEIATFYPDDYPQGTYGFVEPGEKLVWLCRDLPETMRRFTLAHELGHAMLHRQAGQQHFSYNPSRLATEFGQGAPREDLCQANDVREEVTGLIYQQQAEELLGTGLSYDPRSQRELAANIFAAELLMPLERVRALYLAGEVPANKLASVFDVSNAAMLNRLAGLLQETKEPPARAEADRPAEALPAKKQYDEFQQAAIEAPVPALIVAGPGSGKTSTLIGRAEYLIDTLGIPPENILALTFSRKAAEEMQERMQQVLDARASRPGPLSNKDGEGEGGEAEMKGVRCSTFHAFCAELLRTYGSLVGLRQDFAFIDDAEG